MSIFINFNLEISVNYPIVVQVLHAAQQLEYEEPYMSFTEQLLALHYAMQIAI
jgi:hypothetical protein